MKTIIITAAMILGLCVSSCNNPQEEQLDQHDNGIQPDRNYEKAEGDTSVTDEINATGNANSGPVEGP